jgi:long-chain acyl-CoA synthetase
MSITHIDFLLRIFSENKDNDAIIWNNEKFTYNWLYNKILFYNSTLFENVLAKGSVVVLKGDFTPNTISILLSLIYNNCIIIPLTFAVKNEDNLIAISQAKYMISIDENDMYAISKLEFTGSNTFYDIINKQNTPGLVLFSSGTSGNPKSAVHDFSKLLKKFIEKKSSLRTLNFLMFDHWGGLNTMFHILSNGGTVISTKERSPRQICKLIELHKIELLPSSPTFLNLLMLSELHNEFDLSSLRIISYGTEPMSIATLTRLKDAFPNVKLIQTYGLIELGVLKTQSKSNDSLWVKLGGDGYKLRVVDGMLEIKADSAMLGYLNAPSPFTEDGWFKTGDAVEVEDDYFKILGRKSELINIGGEKVYPAEIEDVILQLSNIAEVLVYGEKNSITGMMIVAKIRTIEVEDKKILFTRIKRHCRIKLTPYKVPVKIIITSEEQYGERFKKKRI